MEKESKGKTKLDLERAYAAVTFELFAYAAATFALFGAATLLLGIHVDNYIAFFGGIGLIAISLFIFVVFAKPAGKKKRQIRKKQQKMKDEGIEEEEMVPACDLNIQAKDAIRNAFDCIFAAKAAIEEALADNSKEPIAMKCLMDAQSALDASEELVEKYLEKKKSEEGEKGQLEHKQEQEVVTTEDAAPEEQEIVKKETKAERKAREKAEAIEKKRLEKEAKARDKEEKKKPRAGPPEEVQEAMTSEEMQSPEPDLAEIAPAQEEVPQEESMVEESEEREGPEW